MKWLVWKEYRLQRLVLAVGTLLVLIPYAPCAYWSFHGDPGNWETAAAVSLLFSTLTLAFLGGNAIACERADRSAEFLAFQPISRRTIVVCKLVLPFFMAVFAGGLNVLALVLGEDRGLRLVGPPVMVATVGLCAFGVAWIVSSFSDSLTVAEVSGIVAPFALLFPAALAYRYVDTATVQTAEITFIVGAFGVGLLSLIVGTWYYLRRVEP